MSAARARFAVSTLLAVACAAAAGCGSLGTPTQPKQESGSSSGDGGTTGPIMGAPAPKATPTPSPDPNASPSPSPSAPDTGEGADACGQPLPPPVSEWNVKIHLRGSDNWILDSTPLVCDAGYCAQIGFTDGRTCCPVRPEGNPQRGACELYAVGRAKDTGRPGPTWYLDGHFCTGQANGCENNGDNQYLLNTYRAGLYRACANSGVCGELLVDR